MPEEPYLVDLATVAVYANARKGESNMTHCGARQVASLVSSSGVLVEGESVPCRAGPNGSSLDPLASALSGLYQAAWVAAVPGQDATDYATAELGMLYRDKDTSSLLASGFCRQRTIQARDGHMALPRWCAVQACRWASGRATRRPPA
jgi:hypothetical protein